MFPSAISAIEGASVTTNPDTPAPVLLNYSAGQYFLSVRALTPGAKGAVNIVCGETGHLSSASMKARRPTVQSHFTMTISPVPAAPSRSG